MHDLDANSNSENGEQKRAVPLFLKIGALTKLFLLSDRNLCGRKSQPRNVYIAIEQKEGGQFFVSCHESRTSIYKSQGKRVTHKASCACIDINIVLSYLNPVQNN